MTPNQIEQAAPAAVVQDADKLADGARIVADWLGAGGVPVDQALAQRRADICLGCPENAKKVMWSWLTAPVAKTVLAWIAHKNSLKLKVDGEEDLGTCRQCLCHMPTKIWTPILHIKKHTSHQTMSQFPGHCWVLNESNE